MMVQIHQPKLDQIPQESLFRGRSSLREDLEEKKLLKIGTFNVKNIETNEVYLRELLKTFDILAIQEHWLFSFQLGSIETNFLSHHAYSKAVDDNDPIPPNQKLRGYGNYILFRKNMDLKVKKLIHGENRMVVIEVQSSPPICICNVYMPCRNSKGNAKNDDHFQNCLEQIEEVLSIYQNSHIVLVAGDFNASLSEHRGNAQDVLLRTAVNNNSLEYQQNGTSTFFHQNKTDNVEIDYILFNKMRRKFVKTVTLEKDAALNTSDHVPVIMQLELPVCSVQCENIMTKRKPNWDRCDKQNYQIFIENSLRSFDSFHIGNSSELDILYPLGHLNAVFKLATEDSIPNFKPEVRLKQPRHRPWSEKIHEAIKTCRLTWWEWKKAGASRNPTDPDFIRMRKANKCIRKEQRREAGRRRDQQVESIMSAENDPKTFFRLVKNQRKQPASRRISSS